MTYPFDPELAPWIDMMPSPNMDGYDGLLARRTATAEFAAQMPTYEPQSQIDVYDTLVPGPDGMPAVRLRVYSPAGRDSAVPGLLYLHGGGFVLGGDHLYHSAVLRFADELGVVIASVDYRLAPEHPFPAPVEDCYAALVWLVENAAELGVDPARVGVAGASAGGGLAAAVTLLARDRGGPSLCFQCLSIPELDDRLDTPSMRDYTDTPAFSRPNAIFSWTSYLGSEPGGDDVSIYAAPARAQDLTGLPPAYVAVCQFDPLRDEGIAYAQRLMHAGVHAELHHYPGTFHGSILVESAAVSRRMFADEMAAIRRGLGITPN